MLRQPAYDPVEVRSKTTRDPAVLVTGSSSGIGQACALELRRRGYQVFAGVRSETDAQRLIDQTSGALTPVMLDVTCGDSIAVVTDTIAEATDGDGLDGLINNAGISVACPLEFLPPDRLRQQFEVNVFGQVAVTQAVLPLLRQAKGRIVNISSLSGLVAGPYVGPYAASKHALESISDSLRVELRHFGIKVSVIEPADIETPIWKKSHALADSIRDEVMDDVQKRLPEEVQEKYAADLTAMRAATKTFEQKAIPVSHVTRAVVHALTSRRPKTRYRVGLKTWGASCVLRHLPDRLRDMVILQSLGMK